MDEAELKPVVWVGSSYKDLVQFPASVQKAVGYALYLAQTGGKDRRAKPLTGFAERVYVLHAFQKKSRQGIHTPSQEIAVVRARLKSAAEMHRVWLAQERSEEKPDAR